MNANLREDILYLTARELPNQDDHWAIHNQAQEFLEQKLNQLDITLTPSGHVGFMFPWEDGTISLTPRLTLGFYGADFDELGQHVDFLAGSFPEINAIAPNEISIYIGKNLADALSIQAGDYLPVSISARATQPEFSFKVAGIITPKDYHDSYWLKHFNPIGPLEDSGAPILYGVFVSRESFFEIAERLYPSLDVSYSWKVNLEIDQITFKNIGDMQNTYRTLGDIILPINNNLRVNTTLVELLGDYSTQANIVRVPLYFLLSIVVLMALYYLVMMSSLYLEQVRTEFAILRCRGATGTLLIKIVVWEGIILSGIAILSGPLFAWLMVRWLSYNSPLAVLAEPSWGLSIPQAAWLSAIIAAVASVGSLLLPLPNALKQSITTHHQNIARADRPPWWQRFYVDVFALAIGIILLYRVELYGSIIGGSAEDPQLDLMLLLSPLCLLLGVAAIFLRIFPAILRRGARLASSGRGFPVVLALRQASRDPKHVTRLVLLLMLAMALGLFSTSLDATLARNEVDRSSYFVGSDLRIIGAPATLETENVPGILGKSRIWRSEAALNTSGVSPGIDLLALDPINFPTVAQYRDDFAQQPVEHLLVKLKADWEENHTPLPGTALPGEPAQIGLWFSLPFSMMAEPKRFEMIATTRFEARLHTANGEDIVVTMSPFNIMDASNGRWFFFQGDVLELNPDSYPLSLISLWFHSSGIKIGEFDALWLDDFSVIDRDTGNETIIESFEYLDPFVWNSVTSPLRVYGMESHPHSGDSSLAMYFDGVGISPLRWYGITHVDDLALQPIPALVSPDFQAQTESQPGNLERIKVKVRGSYEWDRMTFKIIGVVDYFPTMYEIQEAGFLVTLQDPLFEQTNLYRFSPIQSNEILISTTDAETTRTNLIASGLSMDQVLSKDSIITELRVNPLSIGLRSVTLFGYFLTTLLSLIGFGTYFYMSMRQRAGNYSILRALGLSPRQLYTTLLVEQIVLMLSGLVFGTVLGILLNQLTLSGLPLRLGDLDTVPPFVVQTDWDLVIRVYFTLVGAFLLSLGMAILFLWRVNIHQVLRIGEE
jgi:ABC-type lipoprotein release transport system permease subunit